MKTNYDLKTGKTTETEYSADELKQRRIDGENLKAINLVRGIKKQAAQRILATCPEWKQRNLAMKGRDNWTADELTLWEQIEAIRARSDELEANPPEDFTNDQHWIIEPA